MLSEFERRAWDNRETCNDHKPIMAMKVAADDIEKGKHPNVKHAIVVLISEDATDFEITYYSAGDAKTMEVEGALMRAVRASQEQMV